MPAVLFFCFCFSFEIECLDEQVSAGIQGPHWYEISLSYLPISDFSLQAQLENEKDLSTNQPIGFHEKQVARWVGQGFTEATFQRWGCGFHKPLSLEDPSFLPVTPCCVPDFPTAQWPGTETWTE